MAKSKAQVEFEASTSGFTSGIKAMDQSLKTLRKELSLNSAELKENGDSIELLSKRKKILQSELTASANKVEALKNKLEVAKKTFGENSNEVRLLNDKLLDSQTAHQKIQNELTQTDRKLDQLENGLEDTEKELKDVDNATKNTGDGFTVFKGILANLGTQVIQGALNGLRNLASGLVDVGKQAMGNYAEFEQLEGGVKKLFGDDYKAVIDNASNGFKTAGMSANEYMETVTSFSASLISSLDGDTKEATRLSDIAIRDMSDNANTFGTDIKSIQNAYQGFAKGNFTMLDNLKLGYGGTKEEMLRLVKDAGVVSDSVDSINDVSFDQIILAINKTQERMKISGTTAKEASYTIEGSTASMKSAWQNMLTGIANENADFGQLANDFVETLVTKDGKGGVLGQIIPRITTVIEGISQTITTMLPKLIKTIVPIIQQNLPIIIQAVQGALQSIIQVLPMLVDAFSGLIPEIVTMIISLLPDLIDAGIKIIISLINGITQMLPDVINAIVEIIPQMIDALLDNLDAILQCGIQLLMALVDAIPVIIEKLVPEIPNIITSIVDALITNIDVLLDGAIQLFMAIIEAIPVIVGVLIQEAPKIIQALIEGMKKAIGKIADVFVEIGGKCSEWISTHIIKPIKKWFGEVATWINNNVVKPVINFFQGLWNGIKKVWDGICNVVKVAIMLVVEIVKGAFQLITLPFRLIWENCKEYVFKAWEGIKEKVSNAVNKVKSVITTVFNAIKNFFSSIWNGIKSTFTSVWNSIVNFLSPIVNKIKSTVSNAFNNVKEKILTICNSIKNTISNVWNGIKNTVSNVVNNIKSKVSSVFNGIKNTASNVWNSIKSKTSSVWNSIKSAIETPINKAKNTVKNVVNSIKGFFSGLKLKLPDIKLPHFKITGKLSLNPPSVPKLKIDWYKDGGILTKPTMFGMNGAMPMVGGEAGAEAILPIEKLEDWLNSGFSRVINNNYYNSEKIERLIEVAEDILAKPTDIYMDRAKVGQAMAETNDNISGQRINFKNRGVIL